jgi:phosphoribosylanthranilate isomerase
MSEKVLTVQVKICGLREPEHALIALEEGADMIGLVFATSPRRVSVDEGKAVADAVRSADPARKLQIVGLFVNETAEHMNAVAEEVGLDRIQLSGDEPAQLINKLRRPAIGSIRAHATDWSAAVRRLQDWVIVTPWAVIMDTHVPGIYGGTGTIGDWDIAEQFARRFRLILAGGLTPENVESAIQKVKPYAVDVSSGVESDGLKDPDKIRSFIRIAKSTTFEEPESAYLRMMGRQS